MIGPGLSALHKTASQKVTPDFIPFNRPYATGKELVYAAEAQRNHHLSGDGSFTKRCHQWIEKQTGCAKALLTHSCTSALDLAALLLDIESGDEVILPSYTFVSTANAFVLRGAVPVFVDIREDTLNLDERLIEAAVTPRTRAIVPVHYAGVSCEMDAIVAIARRHDLRIVEDAAQGILAGYHRGMLPVQPQGGGLHPHKTEVDAVIGRGKASRKIEHHIRGTLSARQGRSENFQANFGLPHRGPKAALVGRWRPRLRVIGEVKIVRASHIVKRIHQHNS